MAVKLSHWAAPLLAIVLLAGMVGCSDEEFGQITRRAGRSVPKRKKFVNSACAKSSLVKPKVDMLFLFDNSSSSFFLGPAERRNIKRALSETIYTAVERFDYRIMVAPLIPRDRDSRQNKMRRGAAVAAENLRGISTAARKLVVSASDNQLVEKAGSIGSVGGAGNEFGFSRAHEMISYHYGTGVFRKNSHMLIALFSNEDADFLSDYDIAAPSRERQDFAQNLGRLKEIAKKFRQFRFITAVAHRQGTCGLTNVRLGRRYMNMSREIYQYNLGAVKKLGLKGGGAVGERGEADSFDLCRKNYLRIFDGISQVIEAEVVGHVYNYWPITNSSGTVFRVESVTKYLDKNTPVPMREGSSNGWTFSFSNGHYDAQNTRIKPSPGEPFTGYLIKLDGHAQVTFPECLQVETSTPLDYFGYIVVAEEPDLKTVFYTKNGEKMAKKTAANQDGWEYLGFNKDQNIRIRDPNDHSPGTPRVNKTGYIFKLYGNAVYSNGDQVELNYLPVPPIN